jgi:hypothetical protein
MNSFEKGVLKLETIAPDALESARVSALEMLASDVRIRSVNFGKASGLFWLSRDEDLVVVDRIIEVDGHKFFIGLFKK